MVVSNKLWKNDKIDFVTLKSKLNLENLKQIKEKMIDDSIEGATGSKFSKKEHSKARLIRNFKI